MIDDVTHGLIFTNIDGEIVEMNELAAQYINCEKNALIYEGYERIFDNLIDYEFRKLKFMEKLLNSGRASLNVESHLDNGEALFLKLESKFNYKLGLIVTTITDETELITLKRQLEQQNSLNAIGEMAASIAHEIRNPMTSLKGFIELLKMNSADDSKKYLNVMDSELHRMESILSDLLYLSKPKQRSFETLSINQVVEEVVELMQPHAIQHNINLIMKCYDPYTAKIFGNENRLKQMLINLVKNAIEVMQNGGTIMVSIEYTDDGVLLAVQDEGQGIAEAELKQLFTPFYTTKEAGTGLGLVLVKKVVEEHNGSVTVESFVGKGTTFKITIPFCEQSFCSEYKDDRSNYWFENDSRKTLPVV
ncbi:ATP-binding protein [Lysinibacillus antri]|uniref:histidine kinase n=1 Tax=Lysinibacillus antri TaxID=2498145 RepID=A0A3S0PQR3_9BACI|nr:ATP-binding protein [Lysinibacillus antri]RUL54299.1 GHKL domain-containing protein [Lysinibacillus antri]